MAISVEKHKFFLPLYLTPRWGGSSKTGSMYVLIVLRV